MEDQIYNTDETRLFWRYLPRNTLTCADEFSVEGEKESKEQITVLVCANAAGTHKCDLLIIGKSAHPRAFKNIAKLPIIYRANKRSWVTQEIFLDWFDKNFVPEARAHCLKSGLLLLDNCPAHSDVDSFKKHDIIVKYLPPNCTVLMLPMDQGAIRSFKYHYRKNIVRKYVDADDKKAFRKDFNIKNAIWCAANAWDAVTGNV